MLGHGEVISFKDLPRVDAAQEPADPEYARTLAWEDYLERQRPPRTSDKQWFAMLERIVDQFGRTKPHMDITKLPNGHLRAVPGKAAANDEWLDAPTVSPFRVIESADFAGRDYAEPEWQIHELIPKMGSGLDIGESKTWKSFKIFDQAAAIHRGVQWRDRPTKKGRSVIVVAEGAVDYPFRMRAYAKHHSCDLADLPAIIPAAPNLFNPRQITTLIAELKKRGATYVVLDTKWRCSEGAEENSAKDMGVVFGSIERISREVGCFCTAISHVGRDASKGVRGSSAQFAAVDVEVLHERDGDVGTSRVTKLKSAQDGATWSVRTKYVSLGTGKAGNDYGSLVVEHVDDAPNVNRGARLPRPGTMARMAYDIVAGLIATNSGEVETQAAREAIIESLSEPAPGDKDTRGGRATERIDALVAQRLLFRKGSMLRIREALTKPAEGVC